MNITITLDNLDQSIRELEELSHKLRRFPEEVGMESASHIAYPERTVTSREGETIISAREKGIAFDEFGTGFYADVYDHDGFHTEPGIWSEDHEQTFQNWQGQDYAYPYNTHPSRKLRNEVDRLTTNTEEFARRYFGN